jgi:uncharacterized protein YfaS (alpha-2-macroglobulin family)
VRRKFVPAVVVSALLFVFFLIFLNLTEIDTILRQSLRAVVPQEVQNVLRPLRAPMVIDYSPDWEATDVALRSPVTITFLTPMNAAATEGNVTIDPAIAGEFSWRGSTLVFTPDEDWPMQQEVTVSVMREARSWLLRRMERGFTFRFTTLGPPMVVETEPSQDARFAYLEDRLTITFNRPMDHESVERRLSVTPEIARQRLAWSDEQLIINGVLTPSTEYRVVIGRGVRDAVHGMRTVEDFEWTFTTTERYPYLAITGVGKEALLTAGHPVALEASLVNVSRVDVELYAIDLPSYIAMSNFSSEEWRQFAPEDLPIRSWSLEPEVELDRDEERTLEFEGLEPGIYYLAAGSPEGARDGQILISTKIALTLKRSSRQALVWATSTEDGQPVAGLALTLYDGEGQVVASGISDEEGIFAADVPSSVDQLHVAGKDEGVVALCSDGWREGVEPWRFEDVLWSWESEQSEYRVQLYTDRPTYRPGDRVNFRGVLRLDDDGEYSLPPVGTDVHVTAANYKDNLIYEEELETSPFGTVHGSFLLNEEVVPGEYFLEAAVDGEHHQIVFRIEEYQEEQFAVSVVADQPAYGSGDVISATVRAQYSFGAPVVGAKVEYTVYSSEYSGPWEEQGADSGECDSWSCWAYGREVAVGTGITDDEGNLQLFLRAGATRGSQSQLLTLGATVTDASGQHVMATTRVPVHQGQFYVGLQPERFVVERGQQAVVNVRTVDTEGEPFGDLPISYTVRLSEWQQVPRTVEGRTYMEWREIVSEIASSSVASNSEGKATIDFVPERGGHYQVEARGRDEAGNSILAETELWVSDPDRVTAWRLEEHDRIGLVIDQETYQPGDVARVLVQSPYAEAVALVTVERGQILSYHVTELESNSAILEIPVEGEYAPNVFVSVILVPLNGAGGDVPGFKVGYAELAVEAPEDLLRITVVPDESSYRPGEMASYTIRTRDHLNHPVSAEVSLDVVDASGRTPAADETDDIVGTFRGRRRLAVRTSQSLAIHVDRKHLVEDYGGGGGIEEQEPRLAFPQVAYWNPAIVTDETGVARVAFQMPASLTTWRALVRGITVDSKVGAAEVDVSTEKELVIHLSAPGFLYVGDEAVIGASVENHTAGPLEVQVSLVSTEGLVVEKSSRTVLIEQGDRVAIEWTAKADQAGSATLTMIAEAEEYRDVTQVNLAVLPFGERTEVLDSYILEDEVRHIITVPAGAQALSLQVDLAPSLLVALADSLEYLRDYPHGCVEQTVSRFLPVVVLDEVATELRGSGTELTAELPDVVESSLQRLYRFQNRDGGWGWSEADDSQVWQTAYAVYGLSHAQEAGYEVNERVLGRGVDWLQQSLMETRDLEEKACVSHVLAEMGEGDLSLARSLAERRRNMDLHTQAHLALALDALGDRQSALRIVEDLADRVVETAHTAHWTEVSHDPAAMSSDGQTTALVLRALLAVDPESPLVPKAVRWLMWTREGAHWGSTYETSEIVLALAEHLRATGESAGQLEYQAFLDGEVLTSDAMTMQERGGLQELTITGLEPGEHQFLLVNEGEEAIYLSTALRYSVYAGTLEAARSLNGPLVERRYELADGGGPVEDCRVGDLIRVHVTVELPADAWYVVVEDPLPAGAQVVQADPVLSTLEDSPREQPTPAASFGEGQAVFFATWLPAGVHEYSYLVRATTPGAFRIMPTEVTLAYDPAVWGRSTSGALTVAGPA